MTSMTTTFYASKHRGNGDDGDDIDRGDDDDDYDNDGDDDDDGDHGDDPATTMTNAMTTTADKKDRSVKDGASPAHLAARRERAQKMRLSLTESVRIMVSSLGTYPVWPVLQMQNAHQHHDHAQAAAQRILRLPSHKHDNTAAS